MGAKSPKLTAISNADVVAIRRGATVYQHATVKIGSQSFKVPVEAHIASSDEKGLFTFISLPQVIAIYGKTSDGTEIIKDSEAPAAIKAIKAASKAGKAPKAGKAVVALPDDLQKQLAAFAKANNVRVVIDPKTGQVKTQKLRAERAAKK